MLCRGLKTVVPFHCQRAGLAKFGTGKKPPPAGGTEACWEGWLWLLVRPGLAPKLSAVLRRGVLGEEELCDGAPVSHSPVATFLSSSGPSSSPPWSTRAVAGISVVIQFSANRPYSTRLLWAMGPLKGLQKPLFSVSTASPHADWLPHRGMGLPSFWPLWVMVLICLEEAQSPTSRRLEPAGVLCSVRVSEAPTTYFPLPPLCLCSASVWALLSHYLPRESRV